MVKCFKNVMAVVAAGMLFVPLYSCGSKSGGDGNQSDSVSLVDEGNEAQDIPQTHLGLYPANMPVGEIAVGDSVVTEFHIMNRGDGTFVLKELVPSNDCITATMESDTIPSMENGKMRVVFHGKEAVGNFNETVEIVGNIPSGFELRIFGTVVEK